MKNNCFIIFFGIILLTIPCASFAYEIQDLHFTLPAQGDFVMGPGKAELLVDPGQKITRDIFVTNRIGKTMDFKIDIEDFTGTRDPRNTIALLGNEKGPYSLKDYIHPEIDKFTLNYGERITIPVEISIPDNAEAGGLYGAVLVRTDPQGPNLEEENDKASTGVKVISRIGTLFFIRVKGDVVNNGLLKDFQADKKIYETSPISFNVFFENNGSIHLNPYGIIEIKNYLGKKIDEIKLDPWFAMPDSLRARKVDWKKDFLFGRYTATVQINRGYDNIVDEKTITFWVIPWKIIGAALVIIFIIVWLFVWIISRFEIKRKT